MRITGLSFQIYVGLIILLAVLGAANTFLPQGDVVDTLSGGQMPASKPVMALATAGIMLFVYGGLGLVGLLLAQKLGFAAVWDPDVTVQQRFLIPACLGVGLGVFFIGADLVFRQFHTLGALPHPPFPTSLVASVTAGIGEETIFRLFFVPFWLWLISAMLLKGRGQETVFWIVVLFSALAFAAGHIPSVMLVTGVRSVCDLPMALLVEIILLNGVLSVLAAIYLRKFGFLAAVGIHFWADVVWHVVFGLIA